ncbi:hypothetical protein AB0M43_37735 [Longispora sp. NPDC051575]|uniref:hypothetical protein n=1 Tax=Longispora sp. NPDC051575 TaxID=3154943 RepID=UPI00343E3ECA
MTEPQQPEQAVQVEVEDALLVAQVTTEILGDIGAVVTALTSRVEATDARVAGFADLDARIAAVEKGGAGGRKHPGPAPSRIDWRSLEPDAAHRAWLWLIKEVGALVDRYGLQEAIPACWYRHGALVEELSALCLSRRVAYDPKSDSHQPLRWHEALAKARTRIEVWDRDTQCLHGRHTDTAAVLAWPGTWRRTATAVARADVRRRVKAAGGKNLEGKEPS